MNRSFNIIRSLIRFWPHIIVYQLSKAKLTIDYEICRWLESHYLVRRKGIRGLLNLLAAYPEFRSLFYFRTKAWWLSVFAKGQTNLEFYTEPEHVGKGLIIWHGFSTVINAKSIGDDCEIWQNVTIGKKTSGDVDDRPVIGDNVLITAGASVIGDISIGNKVTIGAGAIIVKDVPSGTTVVSQPARYILI